MVMTLIVRVILFQWKISKQEKKFPQSVQLVAGGFCVYIRKKYVRNIKLFQR